MTFPLPCWRCLLWVPLVLMASATETRAAEPVRPNIVLVIADDWGFPHSPLYGDPVVKTPNFDRVAKEGILFTHAFISAPSCTPSRSALLTGQYHWRLDESANLWSTIDPKFRTYPDLLKAAGYHVGSNAKGWGPGDEKAAGRTTPAAGQRFASVEAFLKARPKGKPFCFWQGSSDPHRPYVWQSGRKSGMDLKKIRLPACFPDNETVRDDVADYYFEVQRYDALVGRVLKALEQAGELDNTLVMVTGDHGMPFPRGKCNLYDLGTRVPLAARWGKKIKPGRVVNDLISLTDLAPTFLEAAGLKPLPEMTGHSLLGLLTGGKGYTPRDHVLVGRERHTLAQGGGSLLAYPQRAIRTKDFLYIWNMKPDRWPAGVGPEYRDCDGGPTKKLLVEGKNDPKLKKFFDLAFAQRPAEELFDVRKDPEQMVNVAGKPEYAQVQKRLRARLEAELKETADPRLVGGGEKFDQYPYRGRRK
jgi:N-sulfoglucosamine sulfohydrolase